MTAPIYWWQQPVAVPSAQAKEQATQRQQVLTKPAGSLGRLEDIAIRFAAWQGVEKPQLDLIKGFLFAGDHGIANQSVSAFPQSVTVEMLANFVAGGAAISVLANLHQFPLRVINCGTANDCQSLAGVEHMPIAAGTCDFSEQPAMTIEQAQQALTIGADCLEDSELHLVIAGEMGIANTSAASAMAAVLLDRPIVELVGRGTGVSDAQLRAKEDVLNRGVVRAKPRINQAFDVLVELGGFEIGAMAGLYIAAAQRGIPSLVDGFISTAAALLAVKLNPGVRDWLLFAHCSAESGHRRILESLEAYPILNLQMRLGEGSGAAVALPILQQAIQLHNQMATFAEAAVSSSH